VTDSDTEEGDVPVQPAGMTSQEFNEYVAVDDGLQTTADNRRHNRR